MGQAKAKDAEAAKADEPASAKDQKAKAAPSALLLAASAPAEDHEHSDVAATAAKDRDQFLEEARQGLKRIASFAVDTSTCKSEATCAHAKEERLKTLRGLEASALAASRHSLMAGQKACNSALKAGVSEHIAEHARDAAEHEAEGLELEAEKQKDIAQKRIEDAFQSAQRQLVKAREQESEPRTRKANVAKAKDAEAAKAKKAESATPAPTVSEKALASTVSMAIQGDEDLFRKPISSALILGSISILRRHATRTVSLEESLLSAAESNPTDLYA